MATGSATATPVLGPTEPRRQPSAPDPVPSAIAASDAALGGRATVGPGLAAALALAVRLAVEAEA
ncbi:MAG TPA: hypothetical protein VMH24_06765, partial [Candidatus Sulfotelmatobacter sp.]|nr:hypothetical protein [Candidatus Sulfotelmatobacter sp.]